MNTKSLDRFSRMIVAEGEYKFLKKVKFEPGTILSTIGAMNLVLEAKTAGKPYINRHVYGDFGDVDLKQKRQNKSVIEAKEGIIKSQYVLPNTKTLEIQTDLTRGFSMFCLPGEDYLEVLRKVGIE
jgi:hypothetical protein